jgi:hypothetical protein
LTDQTKVSPLLGNYFVRLLKRFSSSKVDVHVVTVEILEIQLAGASTPCKVRAEKLKLKRDSICNCNLGLSCR